MSYTSNKSISNKNLFDLTDTSKVKIDPVKFQSSQPVYFTGLNNYILFQKFSSFRWPAWVNTSTSSSQDASIPIPLMFINNAMRDRLYFTNFLSDEGLFMDPSGMLYPSYAHWSMEIWIVLGDAIYRAADNWKNVEQMRDSKNSIIHSTWRTDFFTLNQAVYGARSTIDEAIIEAECTLKKDSKKKSLLFTIRPYDQYELGALETVEYDKKSSSIRIKGRESVSLVRRPDFILCGGSDPSGDISASGNDHVRSDSLYGLATIGLGFDLKKGDNRIIFRVALDSKGSIPAGNYDFSKVKEDYASYAGIRIRNGANFHHPSALLESWLQGTKSSLLNFSFSNLCRESGKIDYRSAFYIICGYDRMGYSTESINCIDRLLKQFSINEKNVSLDDLIDICYLVDAVSDCFIHIRDIDFLRSRFELIKKMALVLYGLAKKIKKIGGYRRNTLRDYFIAEEHPLDYILIAYALSQYSYMARCLGIFGDEITFKKESDRIAGFITGMSLDPGSDRAGNEFIAYNLLAGYPFRIDSISREGIRSLLGRIERYIATGPLFTSSLGWNVFLSLVVANNMILNKDARGLEIVEYIMKLRDKKYVLPEYIHPATGRGNWGEGASLPLASLMYSTIRNLLFVDYAERLDLFPLSKPEWFEPGSEIRIDDAPSRFGQLSFRVVSTTNEIQIHFEKLPKFVPPDIMINLPMRTKIKHEDDFILKREDERSYVINGWPSIIRFARK